jgi:hypothetical protein
VPNDAQTLEDLLREWETETHSHYSQPPQHAPAAHAQRGNGRLAFAPPPPVHEPTFNERVEPLLQPLRQRVEEAELGFYEHRIRLDEEHARRMQEAEEALSRRDDIVRAKASLHNVSTNPAPDFQLPRPEVMANYSPQQWEDFVADYRRNNRR